MGRQEWGTTPGKGKVANAYPSIKPTAAIILFLGRTGDVHFAFAVEIERKELSQFLKHPPQIRRCPQGEVISSAAALRIEKGGVCLQGANHGLPLSTIRLSNQGKRCIPGKRLAIMDNG